MMPIARITLAGSLLVLSACGFQLRGTGNEDVFSAEVSVSARNAHGELQRSVESSLTDIGATLVREETAPFVIRLLSERATRRAVSTTSLISVSEYELQMDATFEVVQQDGSVILPEVMVATERIYSFDGASLSGSSREETLLTAEMRRDLANQIVRRARLAINRTINL